MYYVMLRVFPNLNNEDRAQRGTPLTEAQFVGPFEWNKAVQKSAWWVSIGAAAIVVPRACVPTK